MTQNEIGRTEWYKIGDPLESNRNGFDESEWDEMGGSHGILLKKFNV